MHALSAQIWSDSFSSPETDSGSRPTGRLNQRLQLGRSRGCSAAGFPALVRWVIGIFCLSMLQAITPPPADKGFAISRSFRRPTPMAISSPAHRSRSVAPEGPSLFAGILRVRHFFSQYLTALSAFATERHTLRVVSVKSFPTEKRRLRPGWPVNGAISSGFGYRKHPFTRRRSFHNGIDIKAKTGTLVCAPAGGTVIYRNRLGANGNLVKIRCADGIILHFAHLKTYSCRLGQRIAPGQAIGTVGSTGRATGPHLHFVVQRQGRYINPLQYLGRK